MSTGAACAVHPRVRGEHSNRTAESLVGAVHPRVRGEHAKFQHDAGPGAAVHPRVRGEHPHAVARRRSCDGSSPRARGTRCRVRRAIRRRFIPACAGNTVCAPSVDDGRRRFIPACAGNTGADGSQPAASAVHPRVRGEHALTLRMPTVVAAVHPRVRGEHDADCLSRSMPRSGSSPRARGTRWAVASVERRPAGSSPRARGMQNFLG